METYSFLRQLADSWALLLLMLFFLGVVAFIFRPGGRHTQQQAAESIFRHETRPAAAADEKEAR